MHDDLVRDGLLTVVEAAAFLRVSRSTLYALMDKGALVYVKIGTARRIPKRALIDVAVANLQGETPK
jgi:excisionase family DNA binding protein